MSDENHQPKGLSSAEARGAPGSTALGTAAGAGSSNPAKVPKVKKQWNNPALRMMGIPRFSLPSRNWLIFWSALAAVGGGIAYDKYEQRQIRTRWMLAVEHYAQQAYPVDRIPRKLTIFIAPPPNDFLEESLRYFRRYVKPVLNAAAVDFEVFTENRQGDIRSGVAEKIRELRRARARDAGASAGAPEAPPQAAKMNFPSFLGPPRRPEEEEKTVARRELYTPVDVLGLYRVVKPIVVHRDDAERHEAAGGVICIGRGAYKEYLTGVHEGLLGPLEPPSPEAKAPLKSVSSPETPLESVAALGALDGSVATGPQAIDEVAAPAAPETDDSDSEGTPVPKPYIQPADYERAEFAPELPAGTILNDKGVPVLFEQPVYVFPVPNVLGFVNIPRKIYRFYTKRYLADDYGARALMVVANTLRPFEFKDTLMAKEEELDWPRKWVESGKEKGSEWVQELEVDDRVTSRMRVFDE